MRAQIGFPAFLAAALVLSVAPARAQSPAKSFVYEQRQLGNVCRPPRKFAAGACVRRCPAGYQDEGRTCRLRSQRFR